MDGPSGRCLGTEEAVGRRTPLYGEHLRLGARMVDFHGWQMPVDYGSILAEHQAVRERAGLFDVSHMGEILVEGAGARAFLDHLLTNRMADLSPGRARYSPMVAEDGGTVDDLVVYAWEEERFLLVVNAANVRKDGDWMEAQRAAFAGDNVRLVDVSSRVAQMALQGPEAAHILAAAAPASVLDLRPFRFVSAEVAGHQAWVSRTGYTGEDGFEIYVRAEDAVDVWRALLQAGQGHGLVPCGLGARDTLRLEAALPLYGQELGPRRSPLLAGLGRFVDLSRPFVGRDALAREQEEGVPRRVAGLVLKERSVPRTGYAVSTPQGQKVGEVTSGAVSPTLGVPIALAEVPRELAQPSTALAVEIRGRLVPAQVVDLPFYRRTRSRSSGT